MALIPTLKLWPYELAKAGAPAEATRAVLGTAQAQLRAFTDLGGEVLFGTDVGYMKEYDPTDEYVYSPCPHQFTSWCWTPRRGHPRPRPRARDAPRGPGHLPAALVSRETARV